MKKLPYIRQGQQLTIDILNGIIKAINSSILERKEYDSMMADITRMFNSYQSKVDNFILKYQDVVDNTPGLMDLLQSYSTLASMVNGTYVASIGSVNITADGFNIQGTMGRAQFEAVRYDAMTYPQYSSLLITEDGGATTLVYNVAPFENTPNWIELNTIPGPQGPQGKPGPQGKDGEPGADGKPGQITSIKGKKASLEECLGLEVAPRSGDAYVVDEGVDGITLYVYFDEDLDHTQSSSWIALNNIRGPVGPQGEMAEIRIQYSNYADGSSPSNTYEGHPFMVISEEGKNSLHIIPITPSIDFRIVGIEESKAATNPSADVTKIYYSQSNETIINTKITIPYLKTVESARILDKDLHLQYRGTEGTTSVGRVVFDPSKIVFTDGFEGFNIDTLKDGDVIIDTSDSYKILSFQEGKLVGQGYLQGPQGPVGPVGASFKLVGNWVTYGYTSTGEVTASAENVGNAYFLPEDDDAGHKLGLYVSSETPLGDYDWVYVGNSEGPQGATGETGAPGPRGARITAGIDFYYDEVFGDLCLPPNSDNAYKQNDLYMNTTTWDLFRVEAIGPEPDYTISAVNIGNIKTTILGDDKIIRTQAEFEALIADEDWFGARSVALVGQFTLNRENNRGIKIPYAVKQIHGFNSARITITNFAYSDPLGKGGLWYVTLPPDELNDYEIRNLEVWCDGSSACGFSNCKNLVNCTGTGTGTGMTAYGFKDCKNLVNCTGTGRGHMDGYGFYNITYASNCKDGGSKTAMWGGTNKNIDIDTCRKTPVTVSAADLTALNT